MEVLYILIALAAVSAVGILLVRTVLNAALCLMACLLAIAAIYVVLNAEFLAVVQVLVYAGGILLLIIFGVMVTRQQTMKPVQKIPAFALCLFLTAMFWLALASWNPGNLVLVNRPGNIGVALMTEFAAPFEAGGILILVSMIGAMIIASFRGQSG